MRGEVVAGRRALDEVWYSQDGLSLSTPLPARLEDHQGALVVVPAEGLAADETFVLSDDEVFEALGTTAEAS